MSFLDIELLSNRSCFCLYGRKDRENKQISISLMRKKEDSTNSSSAITTAHDTSPYSVTFQLHLVFVYIMC